MSGDGVPAADETLWLIPTTDPCRSCGQYVGYLSIGHVPIGVAGADRLAWDLPPGRMWAPAPARTVVARYVPGKFPAEWPFALVP